MPARRRLQPVPDQPQRAVLYVRVSALMGREGDDFHSPEIQIDAMRHMVSAAGLREVAVIDDDIDVSGQTFSRRGLDKVRALVEAGAVDVMAVYNLARFGRNLAEALTFIRWLRDHGVTVTSVQEKIDDSAEGQFMIGMFLNMAELYGAQIGQAWKAVIARRARSGLHHISRPPIGYRRLPDDKIMTPDPVLGPVVTEIFKQYASGVSMSKLVRYMAEKRGRSTPYATIRRMLANPVYVGKVALWPTKERNALWSLTPVYLGDGKHEALVDEETFRKVRRRLEHDSGEPPRQLNPTHPLVGVAFCGLCGRRLRRYLDKPGRPGKPAGEAYDRLICTGIAAFQGVGCAGIGSPRLKPIEDYVLAEIANHVKKLRADPGARAERRAQTARSRTDAVLAERELVSLQREMAKLTKGWQKGIVPDSAYEANIAELAAAEKEMRSRLDSTQDMAERPSPSDWIATAERMLALWPKMDAEQKNRSLKRIRVKVTVRPGSYPRQPGEDRTTVEFL